MATRPKLILAVWFLALITTGGLMGMSGGAAMILSLAAAGFVGFLVKPKKFEAVTDKSDDTKPRLSDTPEVQGLEPVRGVWEDVYWDNKNFNGVYRCTGDMLEAVAVFVTQDALYRFSEAKETGEEAKAGTVSQNARLAARVSLIDIQSVEMESTSQFHGVAVREQYVPPRMSGYKQLKERHPSLNWDGYGFHDSNTRQAIVYVFTKDGDRIRLFQTWDRDLAVKWRTQVSNRIEAALHAAPVAGKPKDGEPDYM